METATLDLTTPSLKYDYDQIAHGHRERVMRAAMNINSYNADAVSSIIEIGRELAEVKKRIDHGKFTEWCEAEFDLKERTAQRWMNVAKEYADPQKRHTVTGLGFGILYLLSAPSTPDEARTEVERAATEGKPITVEFAKEAIRKAKPEPDPVHYTPVWELERKVSEWLDQLASHFNREAVLASLHNEPHGTGPGTWSRDLADWLNGPQQVTYRKSDLTQAINNVREQRRQAKLQAEARVVYVEPEPKAEPDPLPMTTRDEPAPTEDPFELHDGVVHSLVNLQLDDPFFSKALEIATFEQLNAALDQLPLGRNVRKRSLLVEQLGIAAATDPEPVDSQSAEEQAAMAAVAEEREEEEQERLNQLPDGTRVEIDDPDLSAAGIYLVSEMGGFRYVMPSRNSRGQMNGRRLPKEEAIEEAREMLARRLAIEAKPRPPLTAEDWDVEQLPDGKFYAKAWPKELSATDRFDTEDEAMAAALAGQHSYELYCQWLDFGYLCGYAGNDPSFKSAREHAPLWLLKDALAVVQSKGSPRKSTVEALQSRIRKLEREQPTIIEPTDEDLEQEADDLQALAPTVSLTISREAAEVLYEAIRTDSLRDLDMTPQLQEWSDVLEQALRGNK